MVPNHPRCRLVLLIPAFGLAACQPALIYGERTSFNMAAVQLNDNVGEPVKINFGFFRSVATVAPPLGGTQPICEDSTQVGLSGRKATCVTGGDAVSVFSNFKLNQIDRSPTSGTLPLTDLTIRTRFASGSAAREIASDPAAVRSILGVRATGGPDTPGDLQLKLRLVECVGTLKPDGLKVIADLVNASVSDDPNGTRVSIHQGIRTRDTLQLKGLMTLESVKKLCRL